MTGDNIDKCMHKALLSPKLASLEKTWPEILRVLDAILNQKFVDPYDWQNRYWDIYDLCIAWPVSLAESLYEKLRDHVDMHVKRLLQKVSASDQKTILKNYYDEWKQYEITMQSVTTLFRYLNQTHMLHTLTDATDIIFGYKEDVCDEMKPQGLSLEIWRKNMIEPLKVSLVSALLDCINDERQGIETNPSNMIAMVVNSFIVVNPSTDKYPMKLYLEYLETPFLEASAGFFRSTAQKWQKECSTSDYMLKVIDLLEKEHIRCQHNFYESTYPKLKTYFDQHMVIDYADNLLAELNEIVTQERLEDMSNIYVLLKCVPDGLAKYAGLLKEHIAKIGTDKISSLPEENMYLAFMTEMTGLHDKYRGLIKQLLKLDPLFIGALDKACSIITNYKNMSKRPQHRAAELLAKYCDYLMKKGGKECSDVEIEQKFDQVITIFKYVEEKDLFQLFYGRFLAKRSINHSFQGGISMHMEESMLGKLKASCGYEYTNKLNRMMMDTKLSNDLSVEFNKKHDSLPYTFTIRIVQAGCWPLGQVGVTNFVIPQDFASVMQLMESFYVQKHHGRRLNWVHQFCFGELKLTYLDKPYIACMQTYQMAIMMLFEYNDSLTFSEVQNMLELPEDYVRKNVSSLVEAELLRSRDKEYASDTLLYLNKAFKSKRIKIRVAQAYVAKEAVVKDTADSYAALEEDRKIFIQAAIVRIMKERRLMKHYALVEEVIKQTKTFVPSIPMIKKCVEILLEKSYIERMGERDEYSYIV